MASTDPGQGVSLKTPACLGTATQPSQSQADIDDAQSNSDDMDEEEAGPSQVHPYDIVCDQPTDIMHVHHTSCKSQNPWPDQSTIFSPYNIVQPGLLAVHAYLR